MNHLASLERLRTQHEDEMGKLSIDHLRELVFTVLMKLFYLFVNYFFDQIKRYLFYHISYESMYL